MKTPILLFILFALPFLASCNKKNKGPTHFRGIAMTIPYDVQVSDKISSSKEEEIKNSIKKIFNLIDTTVNHWNENSEVSKLQGFQENDISPTLKELLEITKHIYQISNKRFDPTLAKSIKSWKQALDLGILPKEEQDATSFDLVSLNDNHLTMPYENPSFDFDGISKGYTVDLIMNALKSLGLKNIFINWGGEISAIGSYSKNRPWRILIAHPKNIKETQVILDIDNFSTATSGDYLQYWEQQETIYTHIFDPSSKSPKVVTDTSVASVTVKAPQCAIADALATTAMTFSNRKALTQWTLQIKSAMPEVQFWIYYHDDEKL